MHKLPLSIRSSVLRASISASQSLPGYSNELVFDSSLNRSLSSSRRSKQKRKKNFTGLNNSGYQSDEYSADVSDGGGVRPATISRNMSWRPSQPHGTKSDIENTTTDDCSCSSNHPQSSGEVSFLFFLTSSNITFKGYG